MERPRLAAIIPAFNESNTIGRVVEDALNYCDVFVVDDNSSDSTASEAIINGAKVITNSGPNGYENALNYGFNEIRKCDYEYIVTLDADGQHDPNHLNKIIDCITQEEPSIIIAERTILPRITEIIFSKITNFFFKIKDPFSGFKCYKVQDYLDHDFGRYKLTGLNLLNICIVKKRAYITFPIEINDRSDAPRFGNAFNANIRLIRSIVTFFLLIIYRKLT